MVLLDTHIWLWWLLDEGPFKPKERKAMDELASENRIAVSWVTIWETEMLERKDRITLEPDFHSWVNYATRPEVTVVLPVDVEIVLAQRDLPESFHNDPADRLIVATAMLSGYPLATYDRRIVEAKCCKMFF